MAAQLEKLSADYKGRGLSDHAAELKSLAVRLRDEGLPEVVRSEPGSVATLKKLGVTIFRAGHHAHGLLLQNLAKRWESPREQIVFADRDQFLYKPEERVVIIEGQERTLSQRENQLLELLVRDHDKLVLLSSLRRRMFGEGRLASVRSVMKNLRKKVEPDPSQHQRVVTVRGVGYMYMSHIQEASRPA